MSNLNKKILLFIMLVGVAFGLVGCSTPENSVRIRFAEEEYEVDAKVKRIHVGLTEKQEKSNRIAKQWYRIHNLRTILKREKPSVVLSFCAKANYRAMMATTAGLLNCLQLAKQPPTPSSVWVLFMAKAL